MASAERLSDVAEAALDGRVVLFVTGFPDIESKLAAWLLGTPTVSVCSVDEAYAAFDATVAVVCVSDDQLDDRMEAFRTDVLVRHPFCQFAVIESQPLANDRVDDYDVILAGPVSRDDLRATVRQRMQYAVYSSLLREYYLTNLRAIALRRLHDTEDAVPDAIAARLRQLRPQLRALQAELPEDQVREISHTVERHRDFLNRPTRRPGNARTSKYHPATCPACGLVWGEDHGNELGSGFEALGAGVWKCSYCREIVHALHDSNQRITKW